MAFVLSTHFQHSDPERRICELVGPPRSQAGHTASLLEIMLTLPLPSRVVGQPLQIRDIYLSRTGRAL